MVFDLCRSPMSCRWRRTQVPAVQVCSSVSRPHCLKREPTFDLALSISCHGKVVFRQEYHLALVDAEEQAGDPSSREARPDLPESTAYRPTRNSIRPSAAREARRLHGARPG
jgi:hypothetical protein